MPTYLLDTQGALAIGNEVSQMLDRLAGADLEAGGFPPNWQLPKGVTEEQLGVLLDLWEQCYQALTVDHTIDTIDAVLRCPIWG